MTIMTESLELVLDVVATTTSIILDFKAVLQQH